MRSFEFLVLSFELSPTHPGSKRGWIGTCRRQRSELRPHPKEEAMSHALTAVRHRARLGHGVAQRAKPEGRE